MTDEKSRRAQKFKKLVGAFESKVHEQIFEIIESQFELKKSYSERDWLNKNREEVPQTYKQFFTQQISRKKGHPKICLINILQLWTEKSYSSLPFYKQLTENLINHVQIFFPGVKCKLIENPPEDFNLEYLEKNNLVQSRIRPDTGRK